MSKNQFYKSQQEFGINDVILEAEALSLNSMGMLGQDKETIQGKHSLGESSSENEDQNGFNVKDPSPFKYEVAQKNNQRQKQDLDDEEWVLGVDQSNGDNNKKPKVSRSLKQTKKSIFDIQNQIKHSPTTRSKKKSVMPRHQSNLEMASKLHQSFQKQHQLSDWGEAHGTKKNLSYDKMLQKINLTHPRQLVDGQAELIPMCVNTGRFSRLSGSSLDAFDNLGLSISNYFKLLKTLTIFFGFCVFLNGPIYFIFSSGHVSSQATGIINEYLTEWTLGSIGDQSFQCKKRDLKIYDSINLWCPAGSVIDEILQFGLQLPEKDLNEDVCTSSKSTISSNLVLELDPECNLNEIRQNYPQVYDNLLTKQFKERCQGKETCDVFVREQDWPQVCAQKLGERLEIVDKFVKNEVDPESLLDGSSSGGTTIDIEQDDGQVREFTLPEGSLGSNRRILDDYETAFSYVSRSDSEKYYMYAVVRCKNQDVNLRAPFSSKFMDRESISLLVVIIDFIIMLSFMVLMWYISYSIKCDVDRHDNLMFETNQFAVTINNLPKQTSKYSQDRLKSELWEHISHIVREQPQQIEKLQDSPKNRASEIVDIQFAKSNYNYLEDINMIQILSQEVERIKYLIEDAKTPFEEDALIKKQKQIMFQTANLKQRYVLTKQRISTDNEIISAFVHFRSMEGKQRALFAFNGGEKFRGKYCCFAYKQPKHQRLRGKELSVRGSVEPELLIWENFGISTYSKRLRKAGYTLLVIFLIFLCFSSVLYMQTYNQINLSQVPNVRCPVQVDDSVANIDYYALSTSRSGAFHCYCRNLLISDGLKALKNFKFPLDQKIHCVEWFDHYFWVNATTLGIASAIILGNVIIEFLIYTSSFYTGSVDVQSTIVNSSGPMSLVQFINLGLIMFFISFKIKFVKDDQYETMKLQNGTFSELTSKWYVDIATQILLAMFFEIPGPHLYPLTIWIWYKSLILWDQSCSCNKRRSKMLIQQHYENIYIGPEFYFEYRISQMVSNIWVTFMYSSGMPITYAIQLVNFTIIYWVDKYLLLRFYKTPKNFDHRCVTFIISQIKLSFIIHFLMGSIMLSNKSILGYQDEGQFEGIFTIERYKSKHMKMFISTNLVIILFSVVLEPFIPKSKLFNAIKCLRIKADSEGNIYDDQEEMNLVSDDYYLEVNAEFLFNEYVRTKMTKDRFEAMVRERPKSKLKIVQIKHGDQQYLHQHIKRLKFKQSQIQAQIKKLCQLVGIKDKDMATRIKKLQVNIDKVYAKKQYRMCSRIQSYDIRDSIKYKGALELEQIIFRSQIKRRKMHVIDDFVDSSKESELNDWDIESERTQQKKSFATQKEDSTEKLVREEPPTVMSKQALNFLDDLLEISHFDNSINIASKKEKDFADESLRILEKSDDEEKADQLSQKKIDGKQQYVKSFKTLSKKSKQKSVEKSQDHQDAKKSEIDDLRSKKLIEDRDVKQVTIDEDKNSLDKKASEQVSINLNEQAVTSRNLNEQAPEPQTQDPEQDSVENEIDNMMQKDTQDINLDELLDKKNPSKDNEREQKALSDNSKNSQKSLSKKPPSQQSIKSPSSVAKSQKSQESEKNLQEPLSESNHNEKSDDSHVSQNKKQQQQLQSETEKDLEVSQQPEEKSEPKEESFQKQDDDEKSEAKSEKSSSESQSSGEVQEGSSRKDEKSETQSKSGSSGSSDESD